MPNKRRSPEVDVALPVYNEEQELKSNTLKLYAHLSKLYTQKNFVITIVDNASTDATPHIAKELTTKYKQIKYLSLKAKGRGRAIKMAWSQSNAHTLCYMDIDLSTDLRCLSTLIKAISQHGYDLAVGSRLSKQSQISNRPLLREILSRGLNIIIKLLFQTSFADAQCGFKSLSAKNKHLLPHILDDEWFFDSELLIIADKLKMKIFEVPVTWVDNPGSTVRVLGTVIGDFKGLSRLLFTRPWIKIKILSQ